MNDQQLIITNQSSIITTINNKIKLMQKIRQLYHKAEGSLTATNKNNPDQGIEMIKDVLKSIKILRPKNPQLSLQLALIEDIALNNIACAYNKKGKYKAGLYNLQLAQEIQKSLFPEIETTEDPQQLHQVATTHSNLCAILSQMGEHEKALKEISKSIELLNRTKQQRSSDALIAFFYNSAIQYEYLNKLNEAKVHSEKGYSLTKSDPGMKAKYEELIHRLEKKIRIREERIGQYLIKQYKSRNVSKSLHNISADISQSKIIAKQYSTYQTKMPRISPGPRGSSSKNKDSSYPEIRLPEYLKNSKELRKKGLTLGVDSRKKVLSLYDTHGFIPLKNKRSLSKKKETLSKLFQNEE